MKALLTILLTIALTSCVTTAPTPTCESVANAEIARLGAEGFSPMAVQPIGNVGIQIVLLNEAQTDIRFIAIVAEGTPGGYNPPIIVWAQGTCTLEGKPHLYVFAEAKVEAEKASGIKAVFSKGK